jgi:hypothetical protein
MADQANSALNSSSISPTSATMIRKGRRSINLLVLLLSSVTGFIATPSSSRIRRAQPSQSPLNCICIDCKWVTSCAAYHFVETKHEQPHMTENPTFEPREGSPTIHVNIRTIRTSQDRQAEIQRMWKEHQQETERALARAQDHGEEKYDLVPQVTYEYDVVACEDFVQDKGCWVRNMPDEIRRANPDFVPS